MEIPPHTTTRVSPLSVTRIYVGAAAACILLGAFFIFWRGPMPFTHLLQMFAPRDPWDTARAIASNPQLARHYYAFSLATALLFVGLLMLCAIAWSRASERTRNEIFSLAITIAASCAMMIYLLRIEYDGVWSPISVSMHNPAALPIYGHRLLFVWVARFAQKIVPNLSDLLAFFISQCVATLLAVYALGKWSALHIAKSLSWVGQIIGVMMISSCFSYFNFYDIGTVFFTTCALIAIFKRKYWWLVPIVLIGTLNYEGLLLLIPVAAYMAYGKDAPKKWIPPIALSLLAYCAVRFALQAAIPFTRQVDWRVWTNMTKPFINTREIAYTFLALGAWYAAAAMSLRYCDPRLKRLLLLFPFLLGVTFLYGQLHEPRQFDAFIPVVVAIILSATQNKLALETRAPF